MGSSAILDYDRGRTVEGNPEFELPPAGTRGVVIPGFVRPLLQAMKWVENVMFRFGVKVQGRPLLRLITAGARTGKRRRAVLGWFPDDSRADSWVIVASNGGSARHPGWAYNITRNPEAVTADVGEGEVPVDVELLAGAERESMWSRVVTMAPGYGRYTEKSDRQIPLFRLIPRA
jgi:deazaflavin-dependent oxidoreductase (nitroreductase family)